MSLTQNRFTLFLSAAAMFLSPAAFAVEYTAKIGADSIYANFSVVIQNESESILVYALPDFKQGQNEEPLVPPVADNALFLIKGESLQPSGFALIKAGGEVAASTASLAAGNPMAASKLISGLINFYKGVAELVESDRKIKSFNEVKKFRTRATVGILKPGQTVFVEVGAFSVKPETFGYNKAYVIPTTTALLPGISTNKIAIAPVTFSVDSIGSKAPQQIIEEEQSCFQKIDRYFKEPVKSNDDVALCLAHSFNSGAHTNVEPVSALFSLLTFVGNKMTMGVMVPTEDFTVNLSKASLRDAMLSLKALSQELIKRLRPKTVKNTSDENIFQAGGLTYTLNGDIGGHNLDAVSYRMQGKAQSCVADPSGSGALECFETPKMSH